MKSDYEVHMANHYIIAAADITIITSKPFTLYKSRFS